MTTSIVDIKEQVIYAAFLEFYLEGQGSLTKTLEHLEIAKSSFYEWRSKDPDHFDRIRQEARAEAQSTIADVRDRLTSQRLTAELRVERQLLDASGPMIEELLALATGEGVSARDRLGAMRLVKDIATTGLFIPREAGVSAADLNVDGVLPYDPYQGVAPAQITLPPGSNVVIQIPEDPLDIVSIGTKLGGDVLVDPITVGDGEDDTPAIELSEDVVGAGLGG